MPAPMGETPTPKQTHYKHLLSSAILRGAAGDQSIGKAYNGAPIGWEEAVRKWVKHTGGNPLLLTPHHTLTSLSPNQTPSTTSSPHSITSQPYSLAAPSSTSDASGSHTSGTSESFVNIPRPSSSSREEVGVGSPASTLHPMAVPAAREGQGEEGEGWMREEGWWTFGLPRTSRGMVTQSLQELEKGLPGFQGEERILILLSIAHHQHALADHAAALTTWGMVDWAAEPRGTGGLEREVVVGEMIKGRCLQGMSYELTTQPALALQTYLLLPALLTLLPSPTLHHTFLSPSPAPPTLPLPPFTPFRAPHTHLALSLTRAALLSARSPNLGTTLSILRSYHFAAKVWPTSWAGPAGERGGMGRLYLRALGRGWVGFPSRMVAEGEEWTVFGAKVDGGLGGKGCLGEIWGREVKAAMGGIKDFLGSTSTFPRAGEVNTDVESFLEDCVSLWERGGCRVKEGKEVVTILWWGMELTFHSQSLLRQLTRLLQATGQSEDARRTFELYVQLVLKARETETPERVLKLQRRPTEGGATAEELAQEATKPVQQVEGKDTGAKVVGEEHDSDEEFVEMLVLGARILTRDLGMPGEAWRYIVLAGEVVARGGGVERGLRARVEEGKGVVRMGMAIEDMDPMTRPKWQSQGIEHLIASTLVNPSSASTYYHLALARAETRDIDSAIFSIQSSLELDPNNVECWHLLAQLLTAKKDWEGAMKAVEVGIETWEAAEEAILRASPTEGAVVGGNPDAAEVGVMEKDFGATGGGEESEAATRTPTTPAQEGQLINGRTILPGYKSSGPLIPPITASKRLGNVIQLKITQAAITEKLYGATEAMTKQQESFQFFSARSGYKRVGGESGTESIKSSSVRDLSASFVAVVEGPAGNSSGQGEAMMSVTPATPGMNEKSTDSAFAAPSQTRTSQESGSLSDVEGDGESTIQRRKMKLLPKHLHVPGIRKSGRASSLSLRPNVGDLEDLTIQRARTISNGSSVYTHSRSVTPAHSHYHGASSPPAAPPLAKTIPTGRTSAETRVLSSLWLLSAATFRRSGKIQQALGAIQEAEVMDPAFAEIYVQLGLYHVEMQDPTSGLAAFNKALLLHPDYPPAVVNLAKLYLSLNQVDLAHQLLQGLTQTNGWDVPEAWYWLAKVCERQGGRELRVRECLLEALNLEKGRTCRPLSVLTRWQ